MSYASQCDLFVHEWKSNHVNIHSFMGEIYPNLSVFYFSSMTKNFKFLDFLKNIIRCIEALMEASITQGPNYIWTYAMHCIIF
jgi:hypothetical protein